MTESRMRYREGCDRQVLMERDTIYRVTIGNMSTSNVFRQGHRIRVHVTSSRAPHLDPNPNTGTAIAGETRLMPGTQAIYHDRDHLHIWCCPGFPGGDWDYGLS